jgi:hypothetical protein
MREQNLNKPQDQNINKSTAYTCVAPLSYASRVFGGIILQCLHDHFLQNGVQICYIFY